MVVLKGTAVAAALLEENQKNLQALSVMPKLAIVRIGERPDDLAYERGACKRMEKTGIAVELFAFPAEIAEEEFLQEFDRINEREDIHGILLFCPLPRHISLEKVRERIQPEKDVDGISPVNMAKVFAGAKDGFAPCTAEAVVETLKYLKLPLAGKRAVVLGRSMVVGKPLSMLLLQENCTVTICHSKTENLPEVCKNADILAAAVGQAKMVKADYIKEDAIVLDVGMNVDEEGKLCGDVDPESVGELPSYLTPVPGGIGGVTTSVLAKHVILAAKFACEKKG